jgi:hypothetical protein
VKDKILVQVRITLSQEARGLVIRVDGWLADAGVAELQRILMSTSGALLLQLRDLRGADAGGVALLRDVARTGAPLEGLSPYLQILVSDPDPARGDAA